jgi:hypothetical protein
MSDCGFVSVGIAFVCEEIVAIETICGARANQGGDFGMLAELAERSEASSAKIPNSQKNSNSADSGATSKQT